MLSEKELVDIQELLTKRLDDKKTVLKVMLVLKKFKGAEAPLAKTKEPPASTKLRACVSETKPGQKHGKHYLSRKPDEVSKDL